MDLNNPDAQGLEWSVFGDNLPDGLSIASADSVISGKCTKTGKFEFSVLVRNYDASATKFFTIRVREPEKGGGGGCNTGFSLAGMQVLASVIRKSRR